MCEVNRSDMAQDAEDLAVRSSRRCRGRFKDFIVEERTPCGNSVQMVYLNRCESWYYRAVLKEIKRPLQKQ